MRFSSSTPEDRNGLGIRRQTQLDGNNARMIEDAHYRAIATLLRKRRANGPWPPETWDPQDYAHSFGQAHVGLLYAALFVPRFIVLEDHVFLRDFAPRPRGGLDEMAVQLRQAKSESPEALRRLVASYNWVEFHYLFNDHVSDNEEFRLLLEFVMEAWRTRLAALFPDRRFTVRILSAEETGDMPGLGFEEVFSETG